MHSLEQVPDGLEQFFARILRDPDDALIACIQWVVFVSEFTGDFYMPGVSRVLQLYFAMKASTGQLATGQWDDCAIDVEGMERFIRQSSRGLTVSICGKIRLINVFILRYLRTSGLARLANIEQSSLKGALHCNMAQSCLAYIQLDASEYLRDSKQGSARTTKSFSDNEFPLLSYESRHAYTICRSLFGKDFSSPTPFGVYL